MDLASRDAHLALGRRGSCEQLPENASEVPCGWSEPRKSSSSCAHTVRSRQVSLKASYDTIIIKSPPPKTSIYKPSERRGRKDPVAPS